MRSAVRQWVHLVVCAGFLVVTTFISADPIRVRHTEGLVHGFLLLRTLEGTTIADGDLTEVASGENVTAHLIFRFKDGSSHEETTVFSQARQFRLLEYHLIQKGQIFPHQQETWIDTRKGEIKIRYSDREGKEKSDDEKLQLPVDLANGITLTLLKNILPDESEVTVTMLAATPKPRLVNLIITNGGREIFSIGSSRRKAIRYDVNIKIGGVAGWLARLTGKVPPTTHVWILEGEAPAFVKSEGPLCMECPIWKIELASPVWPPAAGERREQSIQK